MRLSLFRCSMLALLCLGLAACQQSTRSPSTPKTAMPGSAVPVNEQIKQVASLIAGARYLKYQCNRSDLPEDEVITQAAYRLAQARGWDTSAYAAVQPLSASLYQGLVKDSTPKEEQCSEFNRLLAPLIDSTRGTPRT